MQPYRTPSCLRSLDRLQGAWRLLLHAVSLSSLDQQISRRNFILCTLGTPTSGARPSEAQLLPMGARRRRAGAPDQFRTTSQGVSRGSGGGAAAAANVLSHPPLLLLVLGAAALLLLLAVSWLPLGRQRGHTAAAAHTCQVLEASRLDARGFHELVRAGRPAVLRGAGGVLPELRTAAARWREREHLLHHHGGAPVMLSVSDSAVFEGVENTTAWDGAGRFWDAWRGSSRQVPPSGSGLDRRDEVLAVPGSRYRPCKQAGSRCLRHVFDRVVVRPATINATLRDALLAPLPRGARAGYVQYESLPPSMEAEIDTPAFARGLKPDFRGLWLGRGATVAHLHHDANENLLLMLRGRKRWRLFPPSAGDALREGYMLEVHQVLRPVAEQPDSSRRPPHRGGADGEGGAASPMARMQLGRAAFDRRNASLSFFTSPIGGKRGAFLCLCGPF
jgi:hypothetical protein